ncbi:MAG TPA: AMIN domain-containing protein, partial [Polyangia bacterium]
MYRRGRGGSAVLGPVLALMAAALVVGPAQAGNKPAARLESLKASEGPGGSTRIEIAVSQRPTFTTFKLEQPARVVLDLSGVRVGKAGHPFDAATFAVGTVSASETEGEGGTHTRITVTLRRGADYEVEPLARGLALIVRPHDAPKVPAPVAEAPAKPDTRAQAAEAALRAAEQKQAAAQSALAQAEAKQAEVEGRKQAAERELAMARAAASDAAKERAALSATREQLDKRGRALADAEAAARRAQEQLAAETARAEAARKQADLQARQDEKRAAA